MTPAQRLAQLLAQSRRREDILCRDLSRAGVEALLAARIPGPTAPVSKEGQPQA